MDIKKCNKKKCKPELEKVNGRTKVSCSLCNLETFTYTSEGLSVLAWNENKVFNFNSDKGTENNENDIKAD